LEALPDAEEIDRRTTERLGLTQPELAVVLACSKITLYAALLYSDVPEDPYLSRELAAYFPPPLPSRFRTQMEGHHLRREIIATHLTNSLVDRAGTTFVFRIGEDTGAPPSDIARAYAIAREVFDMPRFWADVEALDNVVAADTQIAMLLEARRLAERATRWLLRNRRRPLDIAEEVSRFTPGAASLSRTLPAVLVEAERASWDSQV
jgi:glutamate dehydrogenase